MSFGKKEFSFFTKVGESIADSISKCANISLACTPLSVLPAPTIEICSLNNSDKAFSKVSCTEIALG